MIWFVVTEPREKAGKNQKFHAAKYLLEDCADDACLELNYAQVSKALFKETRPWAVVHSGGGTPMEDHDILSVKDYAACVKRWDVPQFAICKGIQLVCHLHGSKVDKMRPLLPGEADPSPDYYKGFFKETGFMKVSILREDPLFNGLPDEITVDQNHAEEVKGVPEGFELLASSQACDVQAVKRIGGAPLYGVQFHPERTDEKHPHGTAVLKNFFSMAKDYMKSKKTEAPR